MAELVALAGSVAQRPNRGGHAWVFLQYLLGFRALGFEVLFLDRLTPDMHPGEEWPPRAPVRWLEEVLGPHGLSGDYCLLLGDEGAETAGLTRDEALERVRRSTLLIDVMGSRVLIVSSALSLSALSALFLLRLRPPRTEP